MSNCLFCKIVNKDIKAEIIYEDESCVGFLDVNPHSMGHTVVIPKRHSENILDIDDKDLQNLCLAVKEVTIILQRVLSPAGFTIGINHGEIAGQVIKHIHVHIIPKYEGDKGGSTIEEVKDLILNSEL